jgi:hypothetical protein
MDEVLPFNESHMTRVSNSEIFNLKNARMPTNNDTAMDSQVSSTGKFLKPEEDQLVSSIKRRHVKFSTEAPKKKLDRVERERMEVFKNSSTPKFRENVYINRSAYHEHQKLKSNYKFDPL